MFKRYWRIITQEPPIKAFFHTFWHSLGTLLPLLIVFMLSKLFSQRGEVRHFIHEGEFCILSAAILTPASYILSKFSQTEERRIRKLPSIVYGIAITVILASSTLFTAVYMRKMYFPLNLDYSLVESLSIIFLVIAVLIFFVAYWIEYDSQSERPSPRIIERRNVDGVGEGFDELP